MLGRLATSQSPPLLLDAVGHGLAALRGSLDFAGLGATDPELELWAFWGNACVPASVIILGCVCVWLQVRHSPRTESGSKHTCTHVCVPSA